MPTLFNDDKDKELQRNQMIAIILMTVLFVGWFWLFPPATTPKPPAAKPAAAAAAQQQAEVKDSPETLKEAPEQKAPDQTPKGWLPPVAEPPANPADDEVTLSDTNLELTFTRVGARLKRARVVLGREGADSAQLVPEAVGKPDADAVYPLGLRFSDQLWGAALDRRRWEVKKSEDGRALVFTLEVPGHARVTKTFRFPENSNVLQTLVSYENLSNEPMLLGLDTREPAVSLTWGPQVASGDLTKGVTQQFTWRKDGKNTDTSTSGLKPPPDGGVAARVPAPDWVAVWTAYFAVAFKPEFTGGEGWIAGAPKQFTMGLGAPRTEVAPGQTATWDYQVYMGSTARQALAAAWPTLGSVQRFFTSVQWMDKFAKFLLGILNWFHDHIYASYGAAIIFLTLLVRIAVFPLTWKSMMSMKKMSALAPEMEKIKQEVGDDQQEMQKRMMELYRERGVNPFGGCLPLLLQMPVFFALYRMLWAAIELRRAPFLWMADLSEPDRLLRLPFSIPFPFGGGPIDAINLLPLLGAVAMLLSTEFMNPSATAMQNSQQKMMMRIMPVMFSLFMYNFASGLNLYILVSTVFGIAQSQIIQRMDIKVDTTKKKTKTAHRPQHFYAAAQARKREAAREMRREKDQRRGGRGTRND